MLKLSRRLDYAILALSRLSGRFGREPISARQLAEESRIPSAILANILKDLTRVGMVRSSRGIHGGYELAVPPAQLSVAQMIQALEGPIRLVDCVELPGLSADPAPVCLLEESCQTKAPLRKLHQRIQSVLEELSFADLIQKPVPEPSTRTETLVPLKAPGCS